MIYSECDSNDNQLLTKRELKKCVNNEIKSQKAHMNEELKRQREQMKEEIDFQKKKMSEIAEMVYSGAMGVAGADAKAHKGVTRDQVS